MNLQLDKQYIEQLKREFHQQRYDDKDFSYQYNANEFMAWFREVVLPTINQTI